MKKFAVAILLLIFISLQSCLTINKINDSVITDIKVKTDSVSLTVTSDTISKSNVTIGK